MISVVIPVYKVEAYLDRCIQSIVQQTYEDLEIILVDDGSPDKCGAICDAWAAKDGRIRVIHKTNGGLSDARNAGLVVASGEYISFVDSDDWLAPDFYQILMQILHEQACDIVSCGFMSTSEVVQDVTIPDSLPTRILSAQEAVGELIRDGAVRQVVWNKLYCREVIQDIPFAVGKYHEDEFWSYQVIGRAQKIAIVDYQGYYYYQRTDSIMGEAFSEKRLDAIEAKCLRQMYLQEYYPELVDVGLTSLYFESLYLGQLALRTMPFNQCRAILRRLSEMINRYPLSRTAIMSKTVTQRLWLIMAVQNMTLTCCIRNWLGVGL